MWDNLDISILAKILSFLPIEERNVSHEVCRQWKEASFSPCLWRTFYCSFQSAEDKKYVEDIRMHGHHLHSLSIDVDQFDANNRKLCMEALTAYADFPIVKLKKLVVSFIGNNPFFYGGDDIAAALENLLHSLNRCPNVIHRLENVDLRYCTILFKDSLINQLALHSSLRRIDIQNGTLISRVTPSAFLNLLKCCPKLNDIHVCNTCCSIEVLNELASSSRAKLKHISVLYTGEDKYELLKTEGEYYEANAGVESFVSKREQAWLNLAKLEPSTVFTIKISYSVPLDLVCLIFYIQCTIHELFLESYMLCDEAITYCLAGRERTHIHLPTKWSLRKIVVSTPLEKVNPNLNSSLLALAARYPDLESLHVFSPLPTDIITDLHVQCPRLKDNGCYTLQSTDGSECAVGKDCHTSFCDK